MSLWSERLLQVSLAIRDLVDDSRLGSFFNLARLGEPRNLVIDEYNKGADVTTKKVWRD